MRSSSGRRAVRRLAVAALLACPREAAALDPTRPLADHVRRLWRTADGLPYNSVRQVTPPERLAQVTDPPRKKPHSTPSHGIGLRPDQKEVWVVDGVYGYVYAYDVTALPPRLVASIPIFAEPNERPNPGWVSFGIDGRYAYPDGGAVIDTQTKKVVARIPTSEKLLQIDFRGGRPVKVGQR